MNKHDSERISGILESLGSYAVKTPNEADIVVFMTCCVRESADTRLFGHVSSLKNMPLRKNTPFEKRIIAIGGCIGQRDGEKLFQDMPFVDIVFGTSNIAMLPQLLQASLSGNTNICLTEEDTTSFSTDLPTIREKPWAAWVPITVGCDNFCTYCIVPYVRGRERSRTIEDIVLECEKYVIDGVKEITLLGQNVNSYGRDLYGTPHFAEILEKVDATGIERLRFATSHPKDLSDDVIEKFATLKSLMPALHLPAQSGSNDVLKRMHRKYTREHYLELVKKLRQIRPDIALSTDIIVGFPGETERDFQDTLALVEEVGYSQVFTFIYSPREGTPAANWPIEATDEDIQHRFNRLLKAVENGAIAVNRQDVGTTQPVLIEGVSKKNPGRISGKTPKNQTVHIEIPEGYTAKDFSGKVVSVNITHAATWYLEGALKNNDE